MPKIVFLPHKDLCPDGAVLEAIQGETILDVALRHGIDIEHACEKSCACTTCHCVVREGSIHCQKAASWRMICWIKLGAWSQRAA